MFYVNTKMREKIKLTDRTSEQSAAQHTTVGYGYTPGLNTTGTSTTLPTYRHEPGSGRVTRAGREARRARRPSPAPTPQNKARPSTTGEVRWQTGPRVGDTLPSGGRARCARGGGRGRRCGQRSRRGAAMAAARQAATTRALPPPGRARRRRPGPRTRPSAAPARPDNPN
ncbi:unnamed protein product [Spodoptera exigua]|nr:unnamed protein product [Spodoptera exigua]